MSMVAFVGYVNSLVVENGILHELPDALLTAQIIMGTDEEKIQEIAGEKEADVQARLQNEQNLKELTRILETLKRQLV
jgi:hypothetical protein